MRQPDHAVVIAGAGPTGMMLAAELALASVDTVVVEPRPGPELEGSRAGGLHARTIEVLDQRGVADRFLSEGRALQVQHYAGILLDISDFPTRHSYGLALWQRDFERILSGWVDELGVPILRQRAVAGVVQDDDGVEVQLSDGGSLRAGYLVGCDGGRSLVRRAAGIEFAGWDPSVSSLLAEAEATEEDGWGIRYDEAGTQAIGRLGDGRQVRIVVTERYNGQSETPTLDDLRRALEAAFGTDFGVHNPSLLSRFTDATRQAASYRSGRVLLAGDAAHVHYPVGGQGLNIGVQDAVNLGWKLAQVVGGISPDSLLDTYHDERHPVASRVLQNTMAQTALARGDERSRALRDAMTELLGMDEPRKRFGAMISGLDVAYDLGDGHPLVGRRMPDLDVVTNGGTQRVYELLASARPLLLNFGDPAALEAVGRSAPRVRKVDAGYEGTWELPVLGRVAPPRAVLVRPDGHVAWAAHRVDVGLSDALGRWFPAG